MEVLGIDVADRLLDDWRAWLLPERQPFVVPRNVARGHGWSDGRDSLTPELRDSFELYGVPADRWIVWLDRREARVLTGDLRRSQPTPHRWPSADGLRDREVVVRYVERGRRPSRHDDVGSRTWRAGRDVLPGARDVAGRFAPSSGPNCFGTVMAAAGVPGAAGDWMQLGPFEDWLATEARRGGRDEDPGTVLVWRTSDGAPAHAAVTLGNGWLLNKASQGWMSPTQVLTVAEGIGASRYPGQRLVRYRLTGA